MSRLTLDSVYTLKKSSDYTTPRQASDVLPVLFGDLTENSGDNPVTPCPCINTTYFVYAISGLPVLSGAQGNTFRFWDGDGDEIGSSHYTVTAAGDYESNGDIAYVTFDADYGDVTCQCMGAIDSDGTLITNPVTVFETIVGGAAALHRTSFAKAARLADELGYVCAGAITAEHQYKTWLNNLAASFLMDWYSGQDGLLRIRLDSSIITGLQPAFFLTERETSDVSSYSYAENIHNQAPVYYAPSYAKADRRFREGVNANYLQFDDGDSSKDVNSIRRYDVRNYPTLEFDWCRNTASIHTIQERIVERFAQRSWLIQWNEITKQAMYAEKGDLGVYAWKHRIDSNGEPMANRYVQVIDKEIPPPGDGLGFFIRETDISYTTDVFYWNGSDFTLGSGQTW